MCSGASYWTQLGRIVFGAFDLKRGISSVSGQILHPKTKVLGGVLEKECGSLISSFFQNKRKGGKHSGSEE